MNRDLCCVLVGNDLYMTRWLKVVVHSKLSLSIPNSCGHDTGGLRFRSSRSDDHITSHGHVLSRVVSRLIRISVFPFLGGLTSLNNKSASEREPAWTKQDDNQLAWKYFLASLSQREGRKYFMNFFLSLLIWNDEAKAIKTFCLCSVFSFFSFFLFLTLEFPGSWMRKRP